MNSEEELVLIFGLLHLVAAVLGGVLLVMFLRSDSTTQWGPPSDEDDSGGGGGNDRASRPPKPTPPGGIPLPDAEPAPARFRGAGKLADAYPRRSRRATPEPQRAPARTPSRR